MGAPTTMQNEKPTTDNRSLVATRASTRPRVAHCLHMIAEYKAALLAGCHAGNTHMMAKYDALNPAALRRLVAGGTQLRPFPRAMMDACYKAAMELYAETSAKNANFKKHLDSLQAFQKDQVLWSRVTEATFDTFMASVVQAAPAAKAAPPAKK